MKKIYLLLTLILFIGCEKEETILPQSQDNLILQFQGQFNLAKYEDSFVRDNLKIRWNDFNKIEEKLETFDFSTNLSSTLRNTKDSIFTKYRLLGHRNNDELKFEVIKFISSENLDAITFENFQNLGFSGTIIFHDLNGKPTKTEVYMDGVKPKKFNNFVNNNDSKYVPENWNSPGRYELIFYRPIIDYYQNSGAGGAFEYRYSGLGSTRSEYVYVSGSGHTSNSSTNPYHNHYDYPHGPAVGSNNHPVEIFNDDPETVDDKIDETSDFKTNEKINCTYEQLIKGSSIPDILIDFFGDDAIFDVTFNVVENLNCGGNSNASGCTTPLGGDAYRIDIDLGYINDPSTPTIFLAQTLIHESIHANLFAAVKALNNGIIPEDIRFASLYEDYRGLKNWSHEFMADHYTQIMQDALREVHPLLNDDQFLNNYDNNTIWNWDDFYEYVSFRGLNETDAGDEYYNNNEVKINLYEPDAESLSTKIPNCN